ncbi:MAG: preprotein translocase subunit SecA [Candidatus Kaelpia aquatica]|nr:preprotein translocase subunit SecA [Candidatus Kaelpia aquatica]
MNFIMRKIVGTQNERELKKLNPLVDKIGSYEDEMQGLTDAELRLKTDQFRERLLDRESLDDILPEAFSVVREVAKRRLKMRHFDSQLIGGAVLHQGKIAEMATGEGKTLVATLPAYLNALSSKGVHIVTVNDYLAKRDRDWMGPVYESLGLTVGVIVHGQNHVQKNTAYSCDVTYGTNNEFGFDYLRDNMVISSEDVAQRSHHYAIVDEVDSILVDEARTPLIISGPSEESVDKYYLADKLAKQLQVRVIIDARNTQDGFTIIRTQDGREEKIPRDEFNDSCDAIVEEKSNNSRITQKGEKKCEEILKIGSLWEEMPDAHSEPWAHYINQSLRARSLFKRDTHYVVKEGQVLIVDEFTGRLMPGRRWSDGLHQAIEAKESLKIEQENQTLATVSFQNYFRMYQKLSGMTGTAATEAPEFNKIYNLDVIVVPTNKPLRRSQNLDVIYKSQREKFNAVVDDISQMHEAGRPVLVGTTSIEKSEIISELLKRKNVTHNVLNAKYHEKEAEIIAQAGRLKAVTIATNMAGRGTDILLGGNPEFLAKTKLSQDGRNSDDITKEESERVAQETASLVEDEHKKVIELGGLHIIGTERHESRRIDNQLRGRSGRQGDPGSSKFYLSLEDDLMRIFGSERIAMIMDRLGIEDGEKIEHGLITKAIGTAQKRVEGFNFEIRKHLLDYDDVMNKQRQAIYGERRNVLFNENLKEHIYEIIDEVLEYQIEIYISEAELADNYDWDGISKWLLDKFRIQIAGDRIKDESLEGEREHKSNWHRIVTSCFEYLSAKMKEIYQDRERELGEDEIRKLEKMIFLHVIDMRWKQHLYGLDYLREGIGLRAYGQRDPLVEYRNESYMMFQEMASRIKLDVVEYLFKFHPRFRMASGGLIEKAAQDYKHEEVNQFQSLKKMKAESEDPTRLTPHEKLGVDRHQTYTRDSKKVGRNDPCPCSSGKKYKKCCYPKYG